MPRNPPGPDAEGAPVAADPRLEQPGGMYSTGSRPSTPAIAPVAVGGIVVDKQEDYEHGGWIDVPICEAIVSKAINIVLAVDGSENSMLGLDYLAEGLMQRDRGTYLEVLHVFDDAKTHLAPCFRQDAVRSICEAKLTGALSHKRYKMSWTRKFGRTAADHINDTAKKLNADYIVMGFVGRKGYKKDATVLASNLLEVVRTGHSTCVVIKDDELAMLPLKKPAKYVVSVSLNKASTKAFLDALRLSKPGDVIHVIYIKSYLEGDESDYTIALRKKYEGFFEGLRDENSEAFSKYRDRETQFVMVQKRLRESTASAVVRYADDEDADFICVGTNALRGCKGKPTGSVSMQVCMETDRNFIISSWVDIAGHLFDKHVRTKDEDMKI